MPNIKKDITGKRFGKVVVLKDTGKKQNRNRVWLCKCDCGYIWEVSMANLTDGGIKSCKNCVDYSHPTHHGTGTRLHRIWLAMRSRCDCKTNAHYSDYGGRGISVCEEWENSFEAFRDWALSNGYQDDLTIDRIDVDGNYCPDNCRWASMKEQNRNQRSTMKIVYHDVEYQCLLFLLETLNKQDDYFTIHSRIYKGWSVDKAIDTPIKHRN